MKKLKNDVTDKFNQSFEQVNKKHKLSRVQREKQNLHHNHSIIEEIKTFNLVDSITDFFSVGGGKEARVLLAEYQKRPICVKYFYPYSSSNIKRTKQQHHTQTDEMASIMAKTEFKNLEILNYFKVNVPKPIAYRGLAFSMELVPLDSTETESPIPAPLLKNYNLEEYFRDPYDFLELILDQIETMFKDASMVHGDLSEFNILVSDNEPVIIDVSQSRLFNTKTFSKTPIRIRIDDALRIFTRDIKIVLDHFEKRYRIKVDPDEIFRKMFDQLPEFVKENKIIENFTNIHFKSSKLVYMTESDIFTHTSVRERAKGKKMLNLMKSLTYD